MAIIFQRCPQLSDGCISCQICINKTKQVALLETDPPRGNSTPFKNPTLCPTPCYIAIGGWQGFEAAIRDLRILSWIWGGRPALEVAVRDLRWLSGTWGGCQGLEVAVRDLRRPSGTYDYRWLSGILGGHPELEVADRDLIWLPGTWGSHQGLEVAVRDLRWLSGTWGGRWGFEMAARDWQWPSLTSGGSQGFEVVVRDWRLLLSHLGAYHELGFMVIRDLREANFLKISQFKYIWVHGPYLLSIMVYSILKSCFQPLHNNEPEFNISLYEMFDFLVLQQPNKSGLGSGCNVYTFY